MLFEYGGAPRKMYAGRRRADQLLGVPEACERIVNRRDAIAYLLPLRWQDGRHRLVQRAKARSR